jgi:hypothetical protein
MSTEPLLVLTCKASDFNATTQTCAAPFYSQQAEALPSMSIDDAQQIGMAIALLWAVAWGIRALKKTLNET